MEGRGWIVGAISVGANGQNWANAVRNHLTAMIRFAVVGATNTFVDVALFTALVSAMSMRPVIANAISYSAGMLNSYILNRSWTFRDSREASHRYQWLRFAAINLLILGISSLIIWQAAPLIGPFKAKLASVVITFGFGYLLNRVFVFVGKPIRSPGMTDWN
jgi:putative flippase GtrA